MDKKYFLFDCEMAGLSPEMSLLSLYGIVLNKALEPIDSIELRIKPDNGRYIISPYAMAVNKIDIINHEKEAIKESEAGQLFYDFAFRHGSNEKMIPAGHNLSLDIRFVKHRLLQDKTSQEGNSWGKFFSQRRLDTASIAQFYCLIGKLPKDLLGSLESLAAHFKLSYDGAHEAKFDTELALKVLKKFVELDGNNLLD